MDAQHCQLMRFGLIVSGHSESEYLPSLFRSLTEHGDSIFTVCSRFDQRRLIGQEKQQLAVVGTRSLVMPRDIEQIGGKVSKFITANPCHFILIVDDLEDDSENAKAIFDRYYSILDDVLAPNFRDRASMHFLCTMLEAYFFRDIHAINQALGLALQPADYPSDVEQIRHPKGELKTKYRTRERTYDEIVDGGRIMAMLDTNLLLSDANACAYLRTLFAWCIEKIIVHSQQIGLPLSTETIAVIRADEGINRLVENMHLFDGIYAATTRPQLAYFGKDVNL